MKTFKETVTSMTGYEIVSGMIDAIENPIYKIDMATFGKVKKSWLPFTKPYCVACAATNFLSKISGIIFTTDTIQDVYGMSLQLQCNNLYLDHFRFAIDNLRDGDIDDYNINARRCGMVELPKPIKSLPALTTKNYKENIKYYKEYADTYLKK